MNSTEPPKHSSSTSTVVRVILITLGVSVTTEVVSTHAIMSLVPRRPEGIRSVPNITWTTYALLGNLIPLCFSLAALSWLFRRLPHRIIVYLLAAIVCFAMHQMLLTDLLQRDFQGKL